MLCDICHKNVATVHLTEIVNDKVVEMHICQNCAKVKTDQIKDQVSVSDLLGGLVDIDVDKNRQKGLGSLRCKRCGLAYNEFKKKGRLGCGDCYKTFKLQLLPLLKKIHGATQHMGKISASNVRLHSRDTKIKDLKEKLNKAVQLEEYEEAARLRDEIKKLEKK